MLYPVATQSEAQKADAYTIHTLKTPGQVLMEHAGMALARHIRERMCGNDRILIVCGAGNNGGDGWVAGRLLGLGANSSPSPRPHSMRSPLSHEGRGEIQLASLMPTSRLKGDAKKSAALYRSHGKEFGWDAPKICKDAASFLRLIDRLKPTIVVDCMFGTGLSRDVKGHYQSIIEHINDWRNRADFHQIISADIPSGLFCDGKSSDVHIRADSTVTFQSRKIVHVSEPGALSCGEVVCADVGITEAKMQGCKEAKKYFLGTQSQPASFLQNLTMPDSNKGSFDHVGILEGSVETEGAAHLAALAALRAGASLVTKLSDKPKTFDSESFPELMFIRLPSPLVGEGRTHGMRTGRGGQAGIIDRLSTLIVGPGLGFDLTKMQTAKDLLIGAARDNIPIILDADGLPLLKDPDILKLKGLQITATPHPGEAGKLLGLSASEIQSDRYAACQKLLDLDAPKQLHITWVLKGSYPIVFNGERMVFVEGKVPALSIGGSGDVLSGAIAACHKQTKCLFDAALLGVSMHQTAGRRLSSECTNESRFLASELAEVFKIFK